jgi:2-hydroxy-3-keto-5-methylthiopentenyl-1-phosphate phosphatase
LRDIGIDNIDVFAAQTRFETSGIDIRYIGPQGNELEDSFKDAYVRLFRGRGYRVAYIGNGASDLSPARQSQYIFATGDLLTRCENMKLDCTPFSDLNDVAKVLELM